MANGSSHSAFSDYVVSLYWSATTMTSTGYGEIVAHTSTERTFAVIVMLVGLLLFGYTLSTLAATLTNAASIRYASYMASMYVLGIMYIIMYVYTTAVVHAAYTNVYICIISKHEMLGSILHMYSSCCLH